ncbi:translation initiation factor IF-2 [Fulvivirga sp. 29W222]|uniref:Translation initiation factor IF-2 n=1 Tax=Fulvivirga marina TaxID=2494733 RepID=A0A937FV31_9BACT|nr:translation initiation factor IF-2 [Fulvivirga marina]MBL6444983.1 translation initiation factor IF-2 [Fulvivirga marina]
MSEEKTMRLSQVARKLNVGRTTIIDFLADKGFEVDTSPNSKVTGEQFAMLSKEFAASASEKEEASGLTIGTKHNEHVVIDSESDTPKKSDDEENILIKNLSAGKNPEAKAEKKEEPAEEKKPEKVEHEKPKLQGIKVLGKIDLGKKKEEPKKPEVKEEPKKEEPKAEEPKKVEPKAEEPKKEEPKKVEPKAEEPKKEEPKKDVHSKAPQPEAVKEKQEHKEKPKEVEKEQPKAKEVKKVEPKAEPEKSQVIEAKADKLKGLKVVGKIELPVEKDKKKDKPVASSDDRKEQKKKKRPRKRIPRQDTQDRGKPRRARAEKEEPSDKEIQDKIKATLAKLSGTKKKSSGSKYRREKRSAIAEAKEEQMLQEEQESKTLKVTEFISANDLASLMNVSVNDVISTCMGLGMFVSINQRLDAESITVIADEFGFNVEFTSTDDEVEVAVDEDSEEDLEHRAPIVTIMGHVDHGKTSLLDFIRSSKVTAGEAGGITQHIGAYDVMTSSGQKIAFLDTPGHEAFTAMRARGAKVTDIVIIVVAADDDVMPQTKEAINHAQVAGVPIVIAINKVDKPNANPDKIKEALSNINILVEDWGGKYQCQEISAKTGQGVDELLEKVLLEAELLELKANPNKNAVGTVIEASLDKGRGYVATLLVQSGVMKVGDVILAGAYHGRVKAMFDHTGKKMDQAGPSTPVQMLGLDGAPQAGDKFNVMETDREAREIATKREQILREQSIRTKKHITLDEIGRRLAIGSFKELNVIVKGDVDGSVEALSDSLLKLSTEEIQVNIIHKAVGQISESDVLLASASDAVIVGFQVRPSASARRLAENEEIEIRLYSVIYDAINDVKDAMEGMLDPEVEEVIVGNVEVRDVFKISKVGTVAGCMVTEGYIKRNNPIRLIRDGIVVYSGEMGQLKRFKDDVNEVKNGYECGISIKNFNDIKEGDVIESYEERETKRTL